MRIGIFGGTFDPVHLGHLVMAEQCREQARLDQVWFVPAARPPHKQETGLTSFERRVDMLALAVAGHAVFRIEEIEKDRPGPSFTVDTLDQLHEQHPHDDFHLILGSDCLPDLPGWREPARIVAQSGLLIVARPGWPIWQPERLREAIGLPAETPLIMQAIESPLVDVSSRDLRCRAAEGRTLRFMVPRAVECYIETHHLYRSGERVSTPC